MRDILIGVFSGIISGVISGFIVYLITKRREQIQFIYQYWEDFLFKAMERNEIYMPTEQLRYIDEVGEKGSEWYKAIHEILDVLNPFELEDREFNEEETKLAKNVLIALRELSQWAKKNKVKK